MIETITGSLPWLFAALLAGGMVYLLASLLLGGLGADVEVDTGAALPDLDADGLNTGEEALGIGCNVIAAFSVGIGAMGLLGTLANWSLLLTILMSLLFGLVLGRIVQQGMRFVLRQQSNDLLTADRLMGATGRVTVYTPAGRLGEMLVEDGERIKYAMKHLADEPLNKGERVIIEDVRDGRLFVRRLDRSDQEVQNG